MFLQCFFVCFYNYQKKARQMLPNKEINDIIYIHIMGL